MKHGKRRILMALLSVCMLFFSACGALDSKSKNEKAPVAPSVGSRLALPNAQGLEDAGNKALNQDSEQDLDKIYVITENDLYNRQMTLGDLSTGTDICYEYMQGTEFFDKYGDYALAKEFSEGKLVQIKRLNSNETLGAVAFTDQTWDYEKAINYTIDPSKNMLKIADVNYRCDPKTKVFTDSGQTSIYAVGDGDVLDIYGKGRTVYSIVIRDGNGTLALENTKLFEGGWLNLGSLHRQPSPG